jgi:phosphoglycerol transferase
MKSPNDLIRSIARSSDFRHVLAGFLATGLVLIYLFRLWDMNPHVPFVYAGDGLLSLMSFQNMKEAFWYLKSSHLGFPFSQDLHDFPAVADTTNLLFSRLLISLTGDIGLTFNIQYFFSYFSGFIGAYIGSRIIRLPPVHALCIGLIFAFLPFHYLHGANHLYLSSYWMIPIWLAVTIKELSTPGWVLSLEKGDRFNLRECAFKKRTLLLLGLTLFSASAGFYFSVFFVFATGFFGLLAVIRERGVKNTGLLLMSSLGAVVVGLQILPILFFQRSMGANIEAVQRSLGEIRFYSLDITKLFLPIRDHRSSAVRDWVSSLDSSLLAGEYAEPLGLLLALSFLTLLVVYVFQTKSKDKFSLLAPLAQIEIFFLAISIVGGGGYFLGVIGFTQIRVWSRITIVLAFPALVFLFQLAQLFANRLKKVRAQYFIYFFIAAFQIFDSTPTSLAPNYATTSKEWNRDQRIAEVIQNSISPRARIFQLPIVKFPESPPTFQQADYEHLRMYLHVPSAYFSYGGVKGRESQWLNRLSSDPETLFTQLALVGFDAVWIDSRGFEGNPSNFALFAEKEIGTSLINAENSPFALYDIRNFSADLKKSIALDEQKKIRGQVLTPISISPSGGMSSLETDGLNDWFWSSSSGLLDIQNYSGTDTRVLITGSVDALNSGNLTVDGMCKLQIKVSQRAENFQCNFVVPKNGAQLAFTSDNLSTEDRDPRDLRFRVVNLKVVQVQP